MTAEPDPHDGHPPWFENVAFPALLRSGRRAYGRAIGTALRAAGVEDLPRNGPFVLGAIARTGSPLSEIVAHLGLSKQAAGQLVDTLVARGYLDRAVDPGDRRRLTVALTDEGRAVAATIRSAVDGLDDRLAAEVGAGRFSDTRAVLGALVELDPDAPRRPRRDPLSAAGSPAPGTTTVPGDAVPSRTSQVVAVARAGLDRPSSPDGDPDAQKELCSGMEVAPVARFVHHLVARTRFIDTVVSSSIADGIDQIVVVGAGYDDRALRFATPGARFFEVDHPATQADKAKRLDALSLPAVAAHPTLVAADLTTTDVGAALAAAGHDHQRRSLFVAEGLLVYLDEDTIIGLLSALAARSAGSSRLVATLATHPDHLDSTTVVEVANAGRRGADAEPWRTILPVAGSLDLLERSGWSVVESTYDTPFAAGHDQRRSLLVVAEVRPPAKPTGSDSS